MSRASFVRHISGRPPMTDRDLLLRAVIANPIDDLPRLMLADYL